MARKPHAAERLPDHPRAVPLRDRVGARARPLDGARRGRGRTNRAARRSELGAHRALPRATRLLVRRSRVFRLASLGDARRARARLRSRGARARRAGCRRRARHRDPARTHPPRDRQSRRGRADALADGARAGPRRPRADAGGRVPRRHGTSTSAARTPSSSSTSRSGCCGASQRPSALRRSTSACPRVPLVGRVAWRVAFVGLLGVAALYPLLATRAKIDDRFDTSVGRTLDGTAFMERAVFSDHGRDDAAGARPRRRSTGCRRTSTGSPVVAEVNTFPTLYGWGNRYAMFTGNPAVVGWDYHQRQQRPAPERCSSRGGSRTFRPPTHNRRRRWRTAILRALRRLVLRRRAARARVFPGRPGEVADGGRQALDRRVPQSRRPDLPAPGARLTQPQAGGCAAGHSARSNAAKVSGAVLRKIRTGGWS